MISDKEFLETEIKMGVSLDNPQFVELGRATAAQMGEYTDIHTVLDYGAGVGAYSDGFHKEGFQVYAYEHFEAHRNYIRQRLPHIDLVNAPLTTDLLAWIETAEHMTDKEIDTLLKTIDPRYILFSSTSERTENDEAWGHINIKTQEEWLKLMDRYGYRMLKEMPLPTSWTKLFVRE